MAAECAADWEAAAQRGDTVDACTDMMKVTLRAVAETLFGDDLAASVDEINRVFPTILSCLAARVSSPVRPPLGLPTANNRRLRPALDTLDAILRRLIAARRRLADGAADDGHGDLLTTLIAAQDAETGGSMSDVQLRDEVMTMMIAGHETTANARSWLWVLLDRHPAETERLRAELVTDTGGRPPAAVEGRDPGDAASLSAGLDVRSPGGRPRRSRRHPGGGGGSGDLLPLCPAPPAAALDPPGVLPAGAVRAWARGAEEQVRLPAVQHRPPASAWARVSP